MSYLSQRFKVVPVLSDQDLTAAATMAGDSINMKNYHRALFICGFQTLAGASCTVEVYSGATDGACTSALTFNSVWMSAAAGAANCDVPGTWASGTSVTITHGTYDNYTLLIEVEAASMDLANGEEWLTIQFTDPGGATGNVQVHALLEPRYGTALTALA